MTLLTSPLHQRHVELGAKFGEFGGWSMPLEYRSGVLKEHAAVRDSVGIFDVSHLGKATVTGPGAAAFVNATMTNDLDRIGPGQAQYTLCCDESGGIVDDLIAYYRNPDEVLLVPNAANTTEVVRRLAEAAPAGIEIANRHRDFVVLAVQGTHSDEVLAALGLPTGHDYMSFAEVVWPPDGVGGEGDGHPIVVCRTGYTGERGYELIAPNAVAVALWDALMAVGEKYDIVACGLGARDTLRTEMGYPLHGQDISIDVTPNQARLGWAVGWSKPEFWGREALVAEKAEGPKRILRGIVATDRAIPRPHMQVSLSADVMVGEVTSGTFSPTLRKGIGMALIWSGVAADAEVGIDIRGKRAVFQLTKPPFVDTSVRES